MLSTSSQVDLQFKSSVAETFEHQPIPNNVALVKRKLTSSSRAGAYRHRGGPWAPLLLWPGRALPLLGQPLLDDWFTTKDVTEYGQHGLSHAAPVHFEGFPVPQASDAVKRRLKTVSGLVLHRLCQNTHFFGYNMIPCVLCHSFDVFTIILPRRK